MVHCVEEECKSIPKVTSYTGGEQCREGHAEVTLSGELLDWCSTNSQPHEGVG